MLENLIEDFDEETNHRNKAQADRVRALGEKELAYPESKPLKSLRLNWTPSNIFNHAVFVTIVGFHLFVIGGNFLSIFVLPFLAPWYIAIPVISLLINLMFAPTNCPLTNLENTFRVRTNRPVIKGFMGHYIIWPAKRRIRTFTRRKPQNAL